MNGRNEPCDCGSGRKQKKCHPYGAPKYGPQPEPRQPPVVQDGGLDKVLLLPLMAMAGMMSARARGHNGQL